MSPHVRMPRNVTTEHLSPEALAEISPGLSLTILAELCDLRLEHLSRMAGGKRVIGPVASAKLEAGLARARAMAEAGTLPNRKPAGAPRLGIGQ